MYQGRHRAKFEDLSQSEQNERILAAALRSEIKKAEREGRPVPQEHRDLVAEHS